jgi:flavin reductase (DIM6/NTAB) family NADH-FMN oxidoreductase RutF
MAQHDVIEQGDPVADGRAFRRCLGQFATGVTVMTAQHGAERAGMAVNSFAALSLEPPLVLWSIRRASGALPIFTQAEHFAVNVLAGDQVEVANLFATPGIDKFAASHWMEGRTGSPVLDGTIATMECAREQVLDGGDHLLVIGRVLHFERRAGEPLLFAQGRYALSQEHPAALQAAAQRTAVSGNDPECSLLRLLYFTSHEMSERFDAHRRDAGLTVGQFRIYGWLRAQPRTLEQLKRVTYLGDSGTEDSLAELMERGHVTCDAGGTYSLTPAGRDKALASRERVRRFEEEAIRGIAPADLETTRRVLMALAGTPELV